MARKSFEVKSFEFIFLKAGAPLPQKEKWVIEQLNKYLEIYDTKTTVTEYHSYTNFKGDVVVVYISKEIDFTTVIHILSSMFQDTNKMLSIKYNERSKRVMVKDY